LRDEPQGKRDCSRATAVLRARSDGLGLAANGQDLVHPLEPRRRIETFEELARFGEQRIGLVASTRAGEPLAMLELCHGEVERDRDLAEERACALEVILDAVELAADRMA